jgi:hypothetical protein
MMMARWIERVVPTVLVLVILVDGALTLRAVQLQGSVRAVVTDALRRSGAEDGRSIPLDGFDASGRWLDARWMSPSGWAVRYAGRSCPYCAQDAGWARLAAELQRRDYPVTILLPRAAERFPADLVLPNDAPQVAFAPMEWLKQFRLTMTPSLLLFSGRGDLIWHRQGVLGPWDVQSALQAIEEATRPER